MYKLNIDFNKSVGEIKPMHAVNNTPTVPHCKGESARLIKDANIPYVRLHDTGGQFGGARYVDIANVFPDFDADENDPRSYDFAFTDVLLNDIVNNAGAMPFYRLGCSIENYHKIKAYNIFPPKDNAKWARICEMIIRHYNEGWANGYHLGIKHWEIWNEPDNEPVIEDNPMWRGTKEQYFELYKAASLHLKKCFPHLKIGGYSSCGFYALSNADFSERANSSSRVDYFIEFFLDFLGFARDNRLPLDFFSWHSYATVKENVLWSDYARKKLDEYGFADCEVYLNEWNPEGCTRRGSQKDASDVLSMMCALQNTTTDMCMYYQFALASSYNGAFAGLRTNVFNTYYAFYAFGKLYELGTQAECVTHGEDIYALAAKKDNTAAIVAVNNSDKIINAEIEGMNLSGARVFVTDENHSFGESVIDGNTITLEPYGFAYIEVEI